MMIDQEVNKNVASLAENYVKNAYDALKESKKKGESRSLEKSAT